MISSQRIIIIAIFLNIIAGMAGEIMNNPTGYNFDYFNEEISQLEDKENEV